MDVELVPQLELGGISAKEFWLEIFLRGCASAFFGDNGRTGSQPQGWGFGLWQGDQFWFLELKCFTSDINVWAFIFHLLLWSQFQVFLLSAVLPCCLCWFVKICCWRSKFLATLWWLCKDQHIEWDFCCTHSRIWKRIVCILTVSEPDWGSNVGSMTQLSQVVLLFASCTMMQKSSKTERKDFEKIGQVQANLFHKVVSKLNRHRSWSCKDLDVSWQPFAFTQTPLWLLLPWHIALQQKAPKAKHFWCSQDIVWCVTKKETKSWSSQEAWILKWSCIKDPAKFSLVTKLQAECMFKEGIVLSSSKCSQSAPTFWTSLKEHTIPPY